jgi:hypothetical protein
MMRGATGPAGDQGRAPAGSAGDAQVTQASCESQRISSRLGRFHPHRQRHQLVKTY